MIWNHQSPGGGGASTGIAARSDGTPRMVAKLLLLDNARMYWLSPWQNIWALESEPCDFIIVSRCLDNLAGNVLATSMCTGNVVGMAEMLGKLLSARHTWEYLRPKRMQLRQWLMH